MMRRKIHDARPAKPRLRKDVLVSNYCRKLSQLQMLIYRMKAELEGIELRREFLHNFFNPRLHAALQRFRDVVAKMQVTALQDYDFIVERTDRFYERKYKRLKQQMTATVQGSQEQHISKETEMNEAIRSGEAYVAQLEKEIAEAQEQFEAACDARKREMAERVEQIRVNGKREIDEYERECEERNRRLESDSCEYCRKLAEAHELTMERMKKEMPQNAVVAGDERCCYVEKVASLRNEVFECNVTVKAMKREFAEMMKRQKEKVWQMQSDSNKMNEIADADIAAMRDRLRSCDERNQQVLQQLLNEMKAKLAQHEAEKCQKESEYDQLMAFLKMEYERAKESMNSEGMKNQAQMGQLEKSLYDNRNVVMLSFERKQKAMEERLKELQDMRKSWHGDSQTSVLAQALENTRKHNEGCRENLLNDFQRKLEKLKNEHDAARKVLVDNMNSMKGQMSSDLELQNQELLKMEKEKEEMAVAHAALLAQMAKDFDDEIDAARMNYERLLKETEDDLNDEMKKLLKERADILDQRKLVHQRQSAELRLKLQQQNQEHLDALEREGYSLTERNQIQAEYQKKFVELQDSMGGDTPFTLDKSIFVNMESAFNDLKRELADRKESIKSQRFKIVYDWKKEEQSEHDRHGRKVVVRPQSRARDQVKQSLMVRLRAVRDDTREEDSLRRQLEDLQGHTLEYEVSSKVKMASLTMGFDEDMNKLVREFDELQDKSQREISEREQELRSELENLQNELNQRTNELNQQIEKISCSKKMYENLFVKESNDLNNKLRELMDEFTESQKSIQMKHAVKKNNAMEIFNRNSSTLSRKCDEQKKLNQKDHDSMVEKHTRREQEFEDRLQRYTDKATSDIEKLKSDHQVRLDLLDEMITNLQEKLNRIKSEPRWNPKVGRPEEIEMIERLQFTLHMKKIQLGNAIKDLSQYRVMYVEQEDQINKKFTTPDVGVMQVLQSRQPNLAIP